ncbi:MAG: hypothetical protein AAF447_20935 [Myxococcota bacterium]
MLRRWPHALLLSFASVALVACGDDSGSTTGMPDMDLDMVEVDMQPDAVPLCDAVVPLASTGVLGETVTIDLDTSMANTLPRDLAGCGAAGDASGQIAVSYTVPGTGDIALEVSTVGGVTSGALETVVQVRTDSCESPAGVCIAGNGAPADGAAIVAGGSMVHFIVTANGGEGPITLRISAEQATPPVIDEFSAVDIRPEEGTDGFTLLTFTGSDAAADVVAYDLEILDGTGNAINLGGGETQITINFGTAPVTTEFTSVSQLISISDFSMGNARQLRVALVDALGARSNVVTQDLTIGAAAFLGETCDDTNLCVGTRIECIEEDGASTCGPDAVLGGLCRGADSFPVDLTGLTAVDGVAPEPVSATTGGFEGGANVGAASSACVTADAFLTMVADANNLPPTYFTLGPESVFLVDLPAGALAYDVRVITDLPGNPAPATGEAIAIYGRTNCVDDRDTSLACFDNHVTAEGMLVAEGARPTLVFENQPPGPLYVFVEQLLFEGLVTGAVNNGIDVDVQFEVIPVITTGTACDPNGVRNRCAIAPCPMGTPEAPVCP